MDNLTFKISGMDCAEEIATLKHALVPLVGDEAKLRFDLLNGKMTVDGDGAAEADIVDAVARTGMHATPWERYTAEGEREESWWKRHGRVLSTTVSGVSVAAGFAVHAIQHGPLHALTGGEGSAHVFPILSIALYVIAIVSGGWFIFPKAYFAARNLRPDMNLLMTIAVIGAVSIQEWFEAGTVTFLFALALLLESWSVGRARRAIEKLLDLTPASARFISPDGGDIQEKPVENVPLRARVLVRPGEKIPLDGVVKKGTTTVNQAPITGESMPVQKSEGDDVYAGTINEDGAIEFEVTKPASDTTLSRIIHMVEEAQSRRASSEQWVEKFARWYTPAMMALALAIAIVPPLLFSGDWYGWFYQALVILVIACPCALVISTPVSVVAGLGAAARNGVLIKGGVYLEKPATLKAVAMDKTGTLTRGEPEIQKVIPLSSHSEDELLKIAAALEASSEHPLARAVLRKAKTQGINFEPADNFQAIKGKGAEGTIDGQRYWIGSHRYALEKGYDLKELEPKLEKLEEDGHTILIVGKQEHVCGFIGVADQVRPESKSAIADIRAAGVEKIVMLTGDNSGTARAVAEICGIDDYRAELLPEDKVAAIKELVKERHAVAMIGDGVNDAPAMASASLGIAMGAIGSDAAIETADVALMSDDLHKLAWLIRHSRRTLRTIRQNIAFSLGLKLVFIVLALFGLATLWMAIAADMGASLLVVFNSLRLLRNSTDNVRSNSV